MTLRDPKDCNHDPERVEWDMFRVTRYPNGEASVWQYGKCRDCGHEIHWSVEVQGVEQAFPVERNETHHVA
jgi:hypothetical protein